MRLPGRRVARRMYRGALARPSHGVALFVLTDRGLVDHYPRRFTHRGRFLLASALLVGWVAVALLAPVSTLLVSLLTAVLGGSILLNVFKEELPSERESSFAW